MCFTLVDVLQKRLNRFHVLFLEGGLLVVLLGCMIFLSPFLDATGMSKSTVSFLAHLPRLWNSLPIECFILMYDLSGFKSGINRHLLTVRSSWTDFLYAVLIGCQIVYYEGITFKMDCKTLQLLDPKQKIFVMVDANLR